MKLFTDWKTAVSTSSITKLWIKARAKRVKGKWCFIINKYIKGVMILSVKV